MPAHPRVHARELGVAPGVFEPGDHNAITDVAGVRVGHATLIEGDAVRTGVTAILPHGGNLYFERVPAAVHVGNGFGKLVGSTQVDELGELETAILLTGTLSVWKVADALVEWMLEQPGMGGVRSLNPFVGETNDGVLNDIRARPVTAEAVRQSIASASSGPVAEGNVGAGTGCVAFGWKGGIGTSSRVIPQGADRYTVGVLVQTNFGGVLHILGMPMGVAPARTSSAPPVRCANADGSILMVIATDAPLSDRNLRRMAARVMMGLALTGSYAANGSGDYAVAFSTATEVPRHRGSDRLETQELPNEGTSALFQAVVEATEEAIYNALFRAATMHGNGVAIEAIPLDMVRKALAASRVDGRDIRG